VCVETVHGFVLGRAQVAVSFRSLDEAEVRYLVVGGVLWSFMGIRASRHTSAAEPHGRAPTNGSWESMRLYESSEPDEYVRTDRHRNGMTFFQEEGRGGGGGNRNAHPFEC